MKSSWRKQRLATKKKHIKRMKSNFIRKYVFNRIMGSARRFSESLKNFTKAIKKVNIAISKISCRREVVK